jgi:hypothetical protein
VTYTVSVHAVCAKVTMTCVVCTHVVCTLQPGWSVSDDRAPDFAGSRSPEHYHSDHSESSSASSLDVHRKPHLPERPFSFKLMSRSSPPLGVFDREHSVVSARESVRPSKGMTSRMSMQMKQGKRKPQKHEINLAVAASMMSNNADQRVIRAIAAKIIFWRGITACIALFSMFVAVAINELCTAGEYRGRGENQDEQEETKETMPARPCANPKMGNGAKFLASFCTAALLSLILLQFHLTLRLKRAETHTLLVLSPGASRQTSAWGLVSRRSLLLLATQLFATAMHTVPYVRKDFRLEYLGNVSVYRFESVLCIVTFVRAYHICSWIVARIHHSYFNLEVHHMLRDEATIRLLGSETLSLRMLALKLMVKKNPMTTVSLLVLSVMLLTTYIFRVAEVSVCVSVCVCVCVCVCVSPHHHRHLLTYNVCPGRSGSLNQDTCAMCPSAPKRVV